MIYLKRFNENVTEWDLNLIRKFCYENLAYLLDGPADIDFGTSLMDKNGRVYTQYRVVIKDINSKWSDIESDICPFLELLEGKYELVNIIANNQIEFKYTVNNDIQWFSVSEVLSGCIANDTQISKIRFLIRL